MKDTIQGLNIKPPKCNCNLAADRIAENKKIKGDADRNKNGVYRHLMQLNDTWDNYRVEGTEYLKRDNAIMVLGDGEDGQVVQVGTSIEDEDIEGITMTSVLFCKHGGLIMPVTSGQENVEVTCSGLIAAGHLVGTGDLHTGFTGEKNWNDVYDGNKTKATTYMEEMGGLDISGILGGID